MAIEGYQTHAYTGDPGHWETRTVYHDIPTSWEIIEGTEYSVRSAGTVWRNDPELAKRLAPLLEAERQSLLKRQKGVQEAERQAVLQLQEAEGQASLERRLAEIRDAAKANDVEKVKTLLANGADVNAKDKAGDTPLHLAAYSNAKEAAELLLAKGADVNAKEKNGTTPLALALQRDRTAIADLLRAHGAKE